MTDIELKLNAWDSNPGITVFCVQGEQKARTLHITLIDRTGVQDVMSVAPVTPRYIDLTGYTPRMYVSKPDNTGVYFPGTVADAENGKVDFTLTGQCVAVPGKADCTISLIKDDVELKIVGIVLDIRKSDTDDFVEASSDEFVELEVLTSQAKEAEAECVAAVERAEQAVEAANEVVQADHTIVEDAKTQAASAKAAAESATSAANAANNAASVAQTAADSANSAADRIEGTDIGGLATNFDNHIKAATGSTNGIHGIRISGGKLQYNAAAEGQSAQWTDVFAKPQFPIGYIIMTASSTNPSTYLGGTWERWGEGRAIVGVDTSDTDFSTAEKTGGEKKHKLTQAEMPAHTHIQDPHKHSIFTASGSTSAYWFSANSGGVNMNNYAYTTFETATNQNTGGDEPHNNMPPYITCFIWKRVA